MARSKEDNQIFPFAIDLLGWQNWLRTLRQNFARFVFLIALQHVSTHARVTLTQS